jgi:hypothetical protein
MEPIFVLYRQTLTLPRFMELPPLTLVPLAFGAFMLFGALWLLTILVEPISKSP